MLGSNPWKIKKCTKRCKNGHNLPVFGQDKFGHPVMYENVANYKCDEITENLEQALIYRRRVFSQMWKQEIPRIND
eukprot:UN09892